MSWFETTCHLQSETLRIAQVTDTHLFADQNGEYFGVNTAAHFKKVLAKISQTSWDGVIFSGDLTQDHSEQSYVRFHELVNQAGLTCPVFWLPGNHDELDLLSQYLSGAPFNSAKVIRNSHWQLLLINTKGPTPAGDITACHLGHIKEQLAEHSDINACVFGHHHPLPVGGYIDKHILENGEAHLKALSASNNLRAYVHGHVHNDYHTHFENTQIIATPATSIQFDKGSSRWQQSDLGAGFRELHFLPNGEIHTQVHFL